MDTQDENGCDASLETWGTDGRGHEYGKGGKDGGPGEDANRFVGPCWGFGGAGFLENSTTARSFLNGGAAGQYGGFGGGGATGQYGGRGGGGYSGGGGGRGGGGGGSYVRVNGTDVEKEVGNDDHGNVRIEQVPPPYPPAPSNHGPTADTAGSVHDTAAYTMEGHPSSMILQTSSSSSVATSLSLIQQLIDTPDEPKFTVSQIPPTLQPVVEEPLIALGTEFPPSSPRADSVGSAPNAQRQKVRDISLPSLQELNAQAKDSSGVSLISSVQHATLGMEHM